MREGMLTLPGMSNRKGGATLPISSSGIEYAEEDGEKRRGRSGARSRLRCDKFSVSLFYSCVIGCTLLVLLVLHLAGARDLWIVLCRRPAADSGEDFGLSQNGTDEMSRSGLVELPEGQGTETRRPKVLALVGIQTGFDSGPRRKALRETWYPSTPEGVRRLEETTGLAFRFVIGHTTDAWKMRALEEEIAEHKDFMRIDVDENYHKLTLKTLAFFRAAYSLFRAEFYVKVDDDIYLRPDRLATLLFRKRTSTRIYLGCMKKGPVITDPKLKWYEPQSYMLGSEYFLHAYGPIYALSSEVVASLSTSRDHRYRMFMNEDVTIGAWMLALDVTHEDNRAICDTQCGPTSVAVWDLPRCSGLCNPTERMRELHADDMCSKSPTLPEER